MPKGKRVNFITYNGTQVLYSTDKSDDIMEFEYKIDTCWGENEEHQEYLNRMGKDRWELVFAKSGGGTFITYTFKRRME